MHCCTDLGYPLSLGVRTLVHVYIPLADGPDVVCEWNSDELHLTQEPIDPSMDCPNGSVCACA